MNVQFTFCVYWYQLFKSKISWFQIKISVTFVLQPIFYNSYEFEICLGSLSVIFFVQNILKHNRLELTKISLFITFWLTESLTSYSTLSAVFLDQLLKKISHETVFFHSKMHVTPSCISEQCKRTSNLKVIQYNHKLPPEMILFPSSTWVPLFSDWRFLAQHLTV